MKKIVLGFVGLFFAVGALSAAGTGTKDAPRGEVGNYPILWKNGEWLSWVFTTDASGHLVPLYPGPGERRVVAGTGLWEGMLFLEPARQRPTGIAALQTSGPLPSTPEEPGADGASFDDDDESVRQDVPTKPEPGHDGAHCLACRLRNKLEPGPPYACVCQKYEDFVFP